MDRFIYRSGEKLRCGFTTGSCAAAASKAAAIALLSGTPAERVELPTPKGVTLDIPVERCEISGNSALCSVIKDSGDDPDITNGIEVCARVELSGSGITIDGGEHILHEGESIVMPARHPHAVYGQEQFKMLLVVVF